MRFVLTVWAGRCWCVAAVCENDPVWEKAAFLDDSSVSNVYAYVSVTHGQKNKIYFDSLVSVVYVPVYIQDGGANSSPVNLPCGLWVMNSQLCSCLRSYLQNI